MSRRKGSHETCLALKSPTTNTGGGGESNGIMSSGLAASVMLRAMCDMSWTLSLSDMYVPPMTMGVGRSGDETQTNPRRVLVCLGLYGVLCGMSCNGMNVHDL